MTMTDSRPAKADDDEISLLDLAISIWAGRITIAMVVVVAMFLGAFVVLRSEPVFRANGLLQLEEKKSALGLPDAMQGLLGGGGQAQSQAEIAIMRSHMVLGDAAVALDLMITAKPRRMLLLGVLPKRLKLPDTGIWLLRPYEWGNEAISVAELDVPRDWQGKNMRLTIIGQDRFRLEMPDDREIEGGLRTRINDAESGLSIVVERLEGPEGRQFIVRRDSVPETVIEMQKRFGISESPTGSSILRTSYDDPSPRRAEQILDAIAQAFLAQNIDRSAAEARNSLDFINEQLPIAEIEVTEAQNALNVYRQEQQSVDVEYETLALLERATTLENELAAWRLREEAVKERYTVNHPVYEALLTERDTLQAQLDEQRALAANLPETQKEIFNLTRDLEVAQEVYVQLLNREQELRVVQASTVGSVRIIDEAYARDIRVKPSTTMFLAVSMIAGLAVGIAWVMVRHAMRKGIRGAQEIEAIGLPVFATVSFMPAAAEHRKSKGALPIHAVTAPDDIVIEALRSLRTSLHFGMLDATSKSILFTSAAPAAGKSFIAVNLAAVAAQSGSKVCIIDADLRKGYLRRYFNKEKDTPGLSEYLANNKTLSEVMFKSQIDGLSFITSGRFPPNPAELLMRSEFADLLAELDKTFDLIIVDAPPTLAVTDPVVIGRYTGARILVARHMNTMMGEVEAVRRSFETTGSKLTGAILNGYKASEVAHLGEQYQSYNYRYSYQSARGDQD